MVDAGFDLVLAELLAARLCHELVSPVGAISNGVEVLEDEPDFAEDAAKLIGQSARGAARRLQFYRVAYGATGPVPDERARSATSDLFAEGKITCDWPTTLTLPEGWHKLACNLMLLASEALSRGGVIKLVRQGDGIAALATGRDALLQEPLLALLAGPVSAGDLTPRTVQAAFTAALAGRLGTRIELGRIEGGIALTVAPASADSHQTEPSSRAEQPEGVEPGEQRDAGDRSRDPAGQPG